MAKVLIIEDDKFLSQVLTNQLEERKHQVFSILSGDKAIETIKQQKPDLILLDIVLPGKSGFEIAEELRRSQDNYLKKIPIIILSNLGQTEDIKQAESLGIHDYLIKAHFSPTEIIGKVEEVLKREQT